MAEAGADCQLLHLGSYALTPQTFFRPELAEGLDKTYALHIGGENQTVRIVDQTIDVWRGEPTTWHVAIHADVAAYLGLLTRELDPQQALAAGLVHVEGDEAEFFRFLDLCGMPKPADL